jgi:hypothetical protein
MFTKASYICNGRFTALFPTPSFAENAPGPVSERGLASHRAKFWLALSAL